MPLFGPYNVRKLKAKRDVEGLIEALGYKKNKKVRRNAARALGQIGDPRAVEPLSAALKDKEHDVVRAAVGALGQIGPCAVRSLIAALKHERQWVREAAVKQLAEIGTPATKQLFSALKSKEIRVRAGAARALGEIGDPGAVEPLVASLEDLRSAAFSALDRLGWQPDRSELGAVYWIAKRQWDKCVEIGALAVEPLIAALKNKNIQFHHLHIAAALERIGDARAVEPLIKALKTKHVSRVYSRTRPAGRTGSRVHPWWEAMSSTAYYVRLAAAQALVGLYQQGALDEQARRRILAHRSTMTVPHQDEVGLGGSHSDTGIGKDFPL